MRTLSPGLAPGVGLQPVSSVCLPLRFPLPVTGPCAGRLLLQVSTRQTSGETVGHIVLFCIFPIPREVEHSLLCPLTAQAASSGTSYLVPSSVGLIASPAPLLRCEEPRASPGRLVLRHVPGAPGVCQSLVPSTFQGRFVLRMVFMLFYFMSQSTITILGTVFL